MLKALLKNLFTHDKRLLKRLCHAVEENIAEKMLEIAALSIREQESRIKAVISHFADNFGMSNNDVAEAVRVLANGAGVAYEILDMLAKSRSCNISNNFSKTSISIQQTGHFAGQ